MEATTNDLYLRRLFLMNTFLSRASTRVLLFPVVLTTLMVLSCRAQATPATDTSANQPQGASAPQNFTPSATAKDAPKSVTFAATSQSVPVQNFPFASVPIQSFSMPGPTSASTDAFSARTASVKAALGAQGGISQGALSLASQQVTLNVSLALEAKASLSPTHYNVMVNGVGVPVQSATYASSRLTLQLPSNTLHQGDEVMVWLDLIDATGRAWAGGVGPLAAR